jgi:hypothetical protein
MAPILTRALLAAGILGALPASAGAQVFVDPGSPTGQEYVIPLEEARRESADPGGERNAQAPQPLFGEGVRPQRERSAPTNERATPTKKQATRTKRRKAPRKREDNAAPARPSPPRRTPPTELAASSPSMRWTIGVPLLVLVAGGLLGLGARVLIRA